MLGVCVILRSSVAQGRDKALIVIGICLDATAVSVGDGYSGWVRSTVSPHEEVGTYVFFCFSIRRGLDTSCITIHQAHHLPGGIALP